MLDSIEHVRAALAKAKTVAVLTGAGISAESGVPTFRGGPEALWENYRPEELATVEAFRRDPSLVWRWYMWRRSIIAGVKPNPGHYALVALEERIAHFSLITQNVDGLHARAGSERTVELHGNMWRTRCTRCGRNDEDHLADPEKEPNACKHCGGLVRPDVVWFGESLNTAILDGAFRAANVAEVFLVIGTSGIVQPAASLGAVAAQNGALVVEINPEKTAISQVAKIHLRGRAGDVLVELLK